MLVTLNWLKEFVDFKLPLNELSDRLTMLGLEMASTTAVGISAENKHKIVLTKVQSCDKHPKADKLSVCKVKAGKTAYTVITNSPKIEKGDFVVFAIPGTVLPNGVEVGEKDLKGVTSQGMLLPKEYLNLEEKSQDIWILGRDEAKAKDEFEIYAQDDTVLELDLTANRSDCLSVIGIAREIAAMLDKDLEIPKIQVEESSDELPQIEILDRNGCPRYAGRIVRGFKIAPSPVWMKRRLELCGIRSINNIVDATNYTLLEIGHPTHAFDLKQLSGEKIIVRRAKKGEKMTTLDGQAHNLFEEDLVIADTDKAVALAGVMGGENSEISTGSTTLLLESAFFDPISIRHTAKRHGMRTEASYRFERTADWGIIPMALDRVIELILQTTTGKVSKINDQYVSIFKDKIVTVSDKFVSTKLGVELELKDIENYLKRLGFTIMVKRENELEVKVPTFRSDVYRPIDLVEEVARIYGYNKIPLSDFQPRVNSEGITLKPDVKEALRNILNGVGLTEVYNFTFTNEEEMQTFRVDDGHMIVVTNPMSSDGNFLRNHLFPAMVRNILFNNRSAYRQSVRLFEFGHVFQKIKTKNVELNETEKLGLVLSGPDMSYERTLGTVEYMLRKLSAASFDVRKEEYNFIHPANSVSLYFEGQNIGYVGELHPDIAGKLELKHPLFLAEMYLDTLSAIYEQPMTRYAVPKVPPTDRDISLVVNEQVQGRDIQNTILKAHEWIREVKIMDIFKGEQIEKGRKSLTFTILFQHPEKTLTDEEVNQVMKGIIGNLVTSFQAELRG